MSPKKIKESLKKRKEKLKKLEFERKLQHVTPTNFLSVIKDDKIKKKYPCVYASELNRKQRVCFDYIESKINKNEVVRLIIAGPAGTGKSHLINALRTSFKRRNEILQVGAFCGAAALASGGKTLHHIFRIKPPIIKKEMTDKMIQDLYRSFKNVKLFIFEEKSMIGMRILGLIEEKMRIAFGSNEPFGNRNVLLLGDFLQLPPVLDRALFLSSSLVDGEFTRLGSQAYKSFNSCFLLNESMRQKNDIEFQHLLSRARIGDLTQEDEELLNTRYIGNLTEEELERFSDGTVIYSEKKDVDAFNNKKLKALQEDGCEIVEILSKDSKFAPDGAQETLRLCVGARVMINKNIDIDAGLVNGCMGFIEKISKQLNEFNQPKYILFRPDVYYGRRFQLSDSIPLVPIEFDHKDDFSKSYFRRLTYPLQLSWSCTAHKLQGATIDTLTIGVPITAERNLFYRLSPMLFYTALSRVRSLKDIAFDRRFNRGISNNPGQFFRDYKKEEERLISLEKETYKECEKLAIYLD